MPLLQAVLVVVVVVVVVAAVVVVVVSCGRCSCRWCPCYFWRGALFPEQRVD